MNATYDALMALLRDRHSCRAFSPKPLEEGVLDALREAAQLAPQAGGNRNLNYSFLVDRKRIQDIADAGAKAFAKWCEGVPSAFIREETLKYGENFFWFGNAPALAAVTCREPPAFLQEAVGDEAPTLWGGELSAAMGGFTLLLAAQTLGLGACCLTGPLVVRRVMEERLALAKRERLVLLVALGHKEGTRNE